MKNNPIKFNILDTQEFEASTGGGGWLKRVEQKRGGPGEIAGLASSDCRRGVGVGVGARTFPSFIPNRNAAPSGGTVPRLLDVVVELSLSENRCSFEL